MDEQKEGVGAQSTELHLEGFERSKTTRISWHALLLLVGGVSESARCVWHRLGTAEPYVPRQMSAQHWQREEKAVALHRAA